MPSVIVLRDGDEITVRIGKLDPQQTAKEIADHFYGFSTDSEITEVIESAECFTVEMTCNDETHDLAEVYEFTPENVAKALKEADNGYDHNLREAGVMLEPKAEG